MPTRLLQVVETATACNHPVVVLGRDIRTSCERLASFCVTAHQPIYEDLATLVESMAYVDRLVPRRRAEGWARQLTLQIPVYEPGQFQRPAAAAALDDAARFLTGDRWAFEFVQRKGPPPPQQGVLDVPRSGMRHVIPFSDGLDSFAQARFSVHHHGRDSVLLVRAGLSRYRILPELACVRVPRSFRGARLRETTYRTRPLVFYTLAAIAAAIVDAEAVVIGENGQGSFGPACLPFADEWWFRSTHPAFVQRWAKFLSLILETPIRFEQPQLWRTKCEVLSELRDRGLLAKWTATSSCATRPKDRYGYRFCGVCGGCLLRAVSAHYAGLPPFAGVAAFDIFEAEDCGRERSGHAGAMAPDVRAVAVRALAMMAAFAHLADSPRGLSTVDREARLVDPAQPEEAAVKLHRLLRRHRTEWEMFMDSLPSRSWVRDIADQL